MSTSWSARADTILSRSGAVGVPSNFLTSEDAVGASNLRLTDDSQRSVVLRLFPTGTPHGDQLIVEPGIFGLSDGEHTAVSYEPLTGADYRRYWLLHTRNGRLALFGLVLVVIGQAIQVSLDIGSAWVWIPVGTEGVALAKALRGILTIAGAALALYQAVLKS